MGGLGRAGRWGGLGRAGEGWGGLELLGRAGEGWGGLGRLQGAVLMFLRIYGFTDLQI